MRLKRNGGGLRCESFVFVVLDEENCSVEV